MFKRTSDKMGENYIIRVKMKRKGKKQPVAKEKIEHSNSKDRRYKVDRENNTYDEIVTDKNGNVIYKNNEPLKQHRGHGSAKKKKKSI